MSATAVLAGVELVKFLITLALQEARRAKLTPEQIEEAYNLAKATFEASDPDLIPDV